MFGHTEVFLPLGMTSGSGFINVPGVTNEAHTPAGLKLLLLITVLMLFMTFCKASA